MKKYDIGEFELLQIQIGCTIRHARLKKGQSQHTLSLKIDKNGTLIGRIERFENIPGWDKILLISQELELDFCSLFSTLKTKTELLAIVNECIQMEKKLTDDKKEYYRKLKFIIEDKF